MSPEQWLDIEARTEAHVVALHCGGRLVSDECEARARDGDHGELHVAVRVLCRGDLPDAFDALVDALDWQDPARARIQRIAPHHAPLRVATAEEPRPN